MRYDEYETCSVCGDFINDVGGCDTCHGDPYFYDEYYEDEDSEDTPEYFHVTVSELWYEMEGYKLTWIQQFKIHPLWTVQATMPSLLVAGSRNLIERIARVARRVFRLPDPFDQIPF